MENFRLEGPPGVDRNDNLESGTVPVTEGNVTADLVVDGETDTAQGPDKAVPANVAGELHTATSTVSSSSSSWVGTGSPCFAALSR